MSFHIHIVIIVPSVTEVYLLILIFQRDLLVFRRYVLLVIAVILQKILLNSLGYPYWVDLLWNLIVDIWYKVSIFLLLLIEVININTPCSEVGIELRLLRKSSLVYFFGPEGVLSQVFPVNSLHRIFIQES